MSEAALNFYEQAYEEAYEEAYREGYNAAVRAIREADHQHRIRAEEKMRKERAERSERISCFAKQRFLGAALVIASAAALMITHGDFAAAVVTIPLGLLISFTRLRLFS